MTTDQMAQAANKRLREFVNRSAAQHLHALKKRAQIFRNESPDQSMPADCVQACQTAPTPAVGPGHP